jgi:hypothetical protein
MEMVSKRSVLTALDDAATGQVIPNGSRFKVLGLEAEVESSMRRAFARPRA